MKISSERKSELLEIAKETINNKQWFDYHDWDGLIECEEELTIEELSWLRENATVAVTVTHSSEANLEATSPLDGAQVEASISRLEAIRSLIASKPLECLGIGQADGRAWPIRDEVVHDLATIIATLSASKQAAPDKPATSVAKASTPAKSSPAPR